MYFTVVTYNFAFI